MTTTDADVQRLTALHAELAALRQARRAATEYVMASWHTPGFEAAREAEEAAAKAVDGWWWRLLLEDEALYERVREQVREEKARG